MPAMTIDPIETVFFVALVAGTLGSIVAVLGPPLPAPQRAVVRGRKKKELRGRRGAL